MNNLCFLLTAIMTGAAVPFQAAANAALGRYLSHPLWGTAASLCVSLVCIVPVMLAVRVPVPTPGAALHGPLWIWVGGVVGAIYVTGALMIAPRLGAASFIVAVIVGQMIASAAIDAFGLMGFPKQTPDAFRLTGLGIIIIGILIMQLPTIMAIQRT